MEKMRQDARKGRKCTCHAKVAPETPNAAPATQQQPGPSGVQARAGSPKRVKVQHLPRKSSAMRGGV